MELTDLHGVGPVMGQRLYAAGFRTVQDVAGAAVDDLIAIPGVGPATAAKLNSDALALIATPSSNAPPKKKTKRKRPEKRVAKSVQSLRRAVPDLARSKKHRKHLTKSTDRLGGWVGDLGKTKVRERFVSEVSKISDQAKKRTGSKKDAKSLRAHAADIERAVRKVG